MYLTLLDEEVRRLGHAENRAALRTSSAFTTAIPRVLSVAAAEGFGDAATDQALLARTLAAIEAACDSSSGPCLP
jgi:hypothetical protein